MYIYICMCVCVMFLSYDMDMEFGHIIHIPLKTLQDPSLRRRNEVKPRSPSHAAPAADGRPGGGIPGGQGQDRAGHPTGLGSQCGKGCGHWLRTLEMTFLVTTTSDLAKSKYLYIYYIYIYNYIYNIYI